MIFMGKYRKTLLIISFAFFCLSCSNNYCDKIARQINEKQENSKKEVILDLKEVFTFEWDSLYICGPYGFDQETFRSIGFNTQYDYIEEGETLFAFIKNDKVVEEKLINCNRISFFNEIKEDSECLIIKSSDAKFKVKNLSEKGQNYWLYK